MWRHNNKYRMYWDLLVIILVVYNSVMIPLSFAKPDEISGNEILERVIDFLFLFDIFLNFRTTFVNPKTNIEITNPQRIAKNYINSVRFPFDILASIPFELFMTLSSSSNEEEGGGNRQLQLLGILKLIRLFRLGRIITFMKVNSSLKIGFKIFQLLFGLLMLVHWLSCIWIILIDFKMHDWIPTKDLDAYRTNFFTLPFWHQYSIIFYYSILLITGNECAPVTFSQTVFASIVILMGSVVTAFIFGNIAALIAAINKKDSHFQDQLDMISQTMRSLKLPEDLQDSVLNYLQYIHETPDFQQDLEKFFSLLSPALKNQILAHLHMSVIRKVEIFRQCSSIEISFIMNNLKVLLFMPGDYIIRQNEDSF